MPMHDCVSAYLCVNVIIPNIQVGIKNIRRVPTPNDSPTFIRVRSVVYIYHNYTGGNIETTLQYNLLW